MKYNNKNWSVTIKPKTSEEKILKQILKAMKKAGWKIVNKKSGGKFN